MAPFDLSSTIKSVTVYRRGAMITREAVLPASEAPRQVQLVGLPLCLDDSSVRVELRGGRDLVAGDLQLTLAVPGTLDELAPPSNEELEATRLDYELGKVRLRELQRARESLSKLGLRARGKPKEGNAPANSPTSARLGLLEFRRQRHAQLSEQIAAAEAAIPALEEAFTTLRERERRASSSRNARAHELRKAAIITLETGASPSFEQATLALHYFVPGARWAPSYTVRFDRAMKAASFELRAMVGQATGEDWEGVNMTLSTANPQQWTELPELDSRRIGRRQPPPAKTGWRPPPVGAEALYADYDRGLGEPDEPEPEAPAPEPEPEEEEPMFDLDALAELSAAPMMPPPSMPPPAASFGAPGGAPPPAPMPMAPPQQSMPMPSRARAAPRKSAGIGNLVGSAIDGLASALGGSDDYGAGGGGEMMKKARGGSSPAFEAEPELLAGRDLLDYGRLRLFPGSSPRRGALRRVNLRVHYEQLSVETLSVEVAFEQIEEARAWAKLLETESPPEGHSWVRNEGGFDYAYLASAPVDLRSTGGFRSLPVDTRDAPSRPRYVSVPRESQDVFRIVGVDNPFTAPLLPGPVDVYVDGKFMLSSRVDLTPADGKLELGIGVEQGIKIARNVKFAEESSGMFIRSSLLAHTLELEIQNHLPDPALVEIRERLPHVSESAGDDINIELGEISPEWEDYEPKRPGPKLEGGKRWKVEVPAGAKRELSAKYSIRIPTNHELVGGNRRES